MTPIPNHVDAYFAARAARDAALAEAFRSSFAILRALFAPAGRRVPRLG